MILDIFRTIYEILKDVLGFISQRYKKSDPVELLKKRQEWQSEFEKHLKKTGLIYGEAIIRDISRMDSYPEINEKEKGISPWFKVEVKGLYHRGIEVILSIDGLVHVTNHDKWRYSQTEDSDYINAYLVGQIPFDVIRIVDWDGDNYYRCPHIYCEFFRKEKQPYENLIYYELRGSEEYRYFEKITKMDDVVKISKRFRKKGT